MKTASGLVLAMVLFATTSATAQRDPSDIAQARALYSAGQAAAESERWSDAAEHFAQAYALSGAPPALFNCAFALRSSGDFEQAARKLHLLEQLHGDAAPAALAERAADLRGEVEVRLAHVELRVPGDAPVHVQVDGHAQRDTQERLMLTLNPGPHSLRLERRDHEPFEWSGELESGTRLTLDVAFRAVPPTRLELEAPAKRPLRRSPLLWTIVGAVALGVAFGVAVPLARRDNTIQPLSERRYAL